MAIGVLIGYLLRHRELRFISTLISFAIAILLILLGISVGSNQLIMNNLDSLGLEALIITLGALAGSLFFAWLIYKWGFQSKEIKSKK